MKCVPARVRCMWSKFELSLGYPNATPHAFMSDAVSMMIDMYSDVDMHNCACTKLHALLVGSSTGAPVD